MNYTYPQQPFIQQQQPINYKPQMWMQPSSQVRPVSSVEEVRAFPIDFDGSVFYFPDLANRKIYTKQINLDGTASINVYEMREKPLEQPISYVTREEFESVISQLKEVMEKREVVVEEVKKPIIPNF